MATLTDAFVGNPMELRRLNPADRCPTPDCDRPACAEHPCPAPGRTEPCRCCGPCARNCSDIADLIETHTPMVLIERLHGEVSMSVEYRDLPEGNE